MKKLERIEKGMGSTHGQHAWAALREKRGALRAAHRGIETMKVRSDEDPDDYFYKKDRCRDRRNFIIPKNGP